MQDASGKATTRGWPTLESTALFLIAAAYIVWVLSLPDFPTQDGPAHLYYANVLSHLLSRTPGLYADFYYIRNLFPPYSLYYYALIGLSRFMPMVLANKLILCSYVALFLYGFRYMARAIGPSADVVTLFVSLELLNWPLMMGFINYCLATSIAMFALGLWLRFSGSSAVRRIAFVLLSIVVMFTHPLPLFGLLAFCGLHLVWRLGSTRIADGRFSFTSVLKLDLLCLVLAGLNLLYVARFSQSHPFTQNPRDPGKGLFQIELSRFARLFFLGGQSWTIYAYYALILLTLAACAWFLLLQFRRERPLGRTSPALFWGGLVVLSAVIVIIAPRDINGGVYVGDRLLWPAWLAVLGAAATYRPASPAFRPFAVAVAMLATLGLFFVVDPIVRPIAQQAAAWRDLPSMPADQVAVVLQTRLDHWRRPYPHLAASPLQWAGMNYLTAHQDVALNSPWLDLTTIPLGARHPVLGDADASIPNLLSYSLDNNPAVRQAVLSRVNFLLQADPLAAETHNRLEQQIGVGWICPYHSGPYTMCVPGDAAPVPNR